MDIRRAIPVLARRRLLRHGLDWHVAVRAVPRGGDGAMRTSAPLGPAVHVPAGVDHSRACLDSTVSSGAGLRRRRFPYDGIHVHGCGRAVEKGTMTESRTLAPTQLR